MRFYARPLFISPRRSSTADRDDGGVYRRAPCRAWGRADLPAIADCPVDVSRVQGARVLHGRAVDEGLGAASADEALLRPVDRVNRQFVVTRPNQLWVADITFVATWAGFVYVAFVTDVFFQAHCGLARGQVTAKDLVLDVLEQALWTRKKVEGLIPSKTRSLAQHPARGTRLRKILSDSPK